MNRNNWIGSARTAITRFADEQDGQDLVEYSLLTAFLALAAVGLLGGIGNTVKGVWTHVSSTMTSAAS